MQIAVDGPAGAGKSTIAKIIAKQLGIQYLDTGAMYRAITYGVLSRGIDFEDQQAVTALAQNSEISFEGSEVFLDGRRVTEEIRTPEVSKNTSRVACIAAVRQCMVAQQRAIAGRQSVIMDGRDIGSVVLPEADYKFYLDASVEERARRRFEELKAKGTDKSLEEIKADIITRDYNDSHREEGPLVCTEDAVVVDTTGMDIQGVSQYILSFIERGGQRGL
ncbi:MAG: (d)CMP kinase [Eubacterium sp.]|nr:(d)CMP kinase [Eubacterium sp.]